MNSSTELLGGRKSSAPHAIKFRGGNVGRLARHLAPEQSQYADIRAVIEAVSFAVPDPFGGAALRRSKEVRNETYRAGSTEGRPIAL